MTLQPAVGLTGQLASYLSRCRYEALPAEVVVRAKQMVLDNVGAMLAGSTLPAGQIAEGYVASCGGRPEATLVGTARLTDCANAALANGISAHADEVDESHSFTSTHPASAAVPVALAVGEARGLDGARMLVAVVAGYDAECRVGLALDPRRLLHRGFMALPICGHFGAAAAATVMLGLSELQALNALGLAGVQAGGLWACTMDPTHMAKALLVGAPNHNGLVSALLAERGFQGPPAVLEGRDGLLTAFSDGPNPAELTRELGERYEILRTSIKKHACGGPIRAPIDGLLSIMREQQLSAADIRVIRVRMAPSGCKVVDNRDDPSICLQHVMAVAAIDGCVGIAQTHSPERVGSPAVRELKSRVELIPDDELERVWVHRSAIVQVETWSNQRFDTRVDHAAGSPANPLSQGEVEEKFERLADGVLRPAAVQRVVEVVRDLERLGDLRHLGELLRTGG